MRIAHLITGLDIGGAEVMLHKLLSAMDRDLFEPLVVSLVRPGRMAERIRSLGIEVQTLGMRRGVPNVGALVQLVQLLRRFRPDLVQTWMYHADLLGTLAVPLANRPKLVWNIRQSDLDPQLSPPRTRLAARAGAVLSRIAPDRIVCCSERARTVHLRLGYRRDILTLIPNGFDLARFRPNPEARARLRSELEIGMDTPVLGLVARFDPQKDLGTFLRAGALVRAQRPDCRFLLCGLGMDDSNTELMAWLGQLGLLNAVHLLGQRSDTPRVFASLDLLVSSSAYGEGFPNVIGEAMACGCPCAVTDVGDSAQIVADTGLAVPPREPRALAAAMEQLLAEGPAALARRGAAARARVKANYSLPRIATRYAELYLSLQRERV